MADNIEVAIEVQQLGKIIAHNLPPEYYFAFGKAIYEYNEIEGHYALNSLGDYYLFCV